MNLKIDLPSLPKKPRDPQTLAEVPNSTMFVARCISVWHESGRALFYKDSLDIVHNLTNGGGYLRPDNLISPQTTVAIREYAVVTGLKVEV